MAQRSFEAARALVVAMGVVLAIALAAGFLRSAHTPPAPAGSPTPELEAATSGGCASGEQWMRVGGQRRRYLVTAPSPAAPKSPPVLLAFHGYTGAPEFFSTKGGLSRAAAAAGWIVVAPEGSGDPTRWELQTLPGANDMQFVRSLLDRLGTNGCADLGNIAVAGYSNGAGFAARVACEIETVAALLVSGANLGPTCPEAAGRSVVVVHSRDDEVVPIEGGPVLAGKLWATALSETVGSWRRGGAGVTEVVVDGAGHRWPTGATAAFLERLPEA